MKPNLVLRVRHGEAKIATFVPFRLIAADEI